MTLSTLVIMIAIVAAVLTGLVQYFKKTENFFISYLQNFVGALFIFSGWVKAIDPLGTAYKMEQYFAEFESTFEGTWFSFLSPMFPALAEYAIAFSVVMIVFEIVLGVMLLIGSSPKFTSLAFLLLVAFFTFLTGFTYLTGYVPEGVNFFEFGKWGPYVETNMKVTDCGCFGDFLKLEPRVSFMKDLVLLVPGILFVIFSGQMHQLFTKGIRFALVLATTIGVSLYCFSNYVWDLPHIDFRPFKINADVAMQKTLEEEAAQNVEIIAYKLTNKATGEVQEIPFAEFLAKVSDYPKEEWEYDQIKSEPTVVATKISDFEVSNTSGEDMTEAILTEERYSFMVVAYKLKGDEGVTTEAYSDTTYVMDTIKVEGTDSLTIVKKVDQVTEKNRNVTKYYWKDSYLKPWQEIVNPIMAAAKEDGHVVYGVTGYADPEKLSDFSKVSNGNYPFFTADDILLKTIVRSNPGVVLWKNGKIIHKWHYSKLPSFPEIKAKYLK